MHRHYGCVYYAQLAVAIAGLVIIAFVLFTHALAIVWAKRKFYCRPPADVELANLPGISILKPVVGIDRNVYSNLETYFTLSYPRYELLFCLENENDAANMVVETLMEKYPNVDARVFNSPRRYDVNPKINNMMQGYEYAKYDLIMVSDSGVKVLPDTLTDMALCMKEEDVGIVHQMPFVEQRPGFYSVVQTVFFGGSHAKWYISSNCVGILCCTGMSCLMRKAPLDELPGGLAHFGRYLAEDYFLANYFVSKGYKLRLSHYPALQDGGGDFAGLRRRLVRWVQLRTAMVPHVVLLEPISECILSGLLGAYGFSFFFPGHVSQPAYFLVHCLVWLVLDYALLLCCMNPANGVPFSRLAYVCAWIICTCMLPINVLSSFGQSEIVWRDKRFRLHWGGVTTEMPGLANNSKTAIRQAV